MNTLDFQPRLADVYFDVLAELRECESAIEYNFAAEPDDDYEYEEQYIDSLRKLLHSIRDVLGESAEEYLGAARNRRGESGTP